MSSILTNNGAMVALQTLNSINSDLSKTQSMISTGKDVASAKDNSSVWAISKVMESDVAGFNAISDSLALGESTLAVASEAAETVTDLLTQIKEKVVSAQEENVDRDKIQTDIDALVGQVKSVIGAAQFNGLSLVEGTEDVNILSSLDRASNGTVTASDITVKRQDLSTSAGTFGTALSDAASAAYGTVNGTTNSDFTTDAGGTEAIMGITYGSDGDTYSMTIGGHEVSYTTASGDDADSVRDALASQINALGIEGISVDASTSGKLSVLNTNAFSDVALTADSTTSTNFEVEEINGVDITDANAATLNQRAATIDFSTSAGVNEGDSFKVTVGSSSYTYVAGKDENMEDVARGLKTAIDSAATEGVTTAVQKDETTGQWKLAVDDDNGDGTSTTLKLTVGTGGEASGGLFGLDNIDVTTNDGADAALGNIETLISNAVDAASEFGSAQGRIQTQSTFISNLTDALTSGIGSMVDADMEEASAKLQALQVQQQLGVQSLSIANQAPQTILSLFG
ncbi:flagellin [Celeribacter ethanolicus]|uniref:Flagellin n=1 Tax=Celeribacter ethanolicus TaxID=1758178 RepID=A0A291GE69_9RHOB|nr:flagellin [Celeribacter ethanolicus]ATG48448.1 flagellin [Celeribacter ethanolicus]TNE64108.1 MAG: flagellin [Paracoccaceae bacterium]